MEGGAGFWKFHYSQAAVDAIVEDSMVVVEEGTLDLFAGFIGFFGVAGFVSARNSPQQP